MKYFIGIRRSLSYPRQSSSHIFKTSVLFGSFARESDQIALGHPMLDPHRVSAGGHQPNSAAPARRPLLIAANMVARHDGPGGGAAHPPGLQIGGRRAPTKSINIWMESWIYRGLLNCSLHRSEG
jgi:hypothetical protein